jgi:isoamylase
MCGIPVRAGDDGGMKLWPGDPSPLGAHFDGTGANFAVYAPHAEAVDLCLFSEIGETRMSLPEMHGGVWHGYLPLIEPGQAYGYRVHGPWDPAAGITCNPAKLLLDPYAKAIEGQVVPSGALRMRGSDGRPDPQDSADLVPRSIVVNPYFDWTNDRPIGRPWSDTIVYEVHVKGATMRLPSVPDDFSGTYAALAHSSFLDHVVELGATAVELMPVHQFVHDGFLLDRGLRNYWGYNSIGFFAPHNEYAALGQRGQQVQEFKRMVKAMHEHDLEVILDVVYNHTGEGGFDGPTLSFRGYDGTYYRGQADDRSKYVDSTGTGNALNFSHSYVLQLVMDSLRYWVTDMHVDGFRFDLAVALSREENGRERVSAFFDLVQQDPVLSRVKLIAEPWDIGMGGYQVGNFPPQWAEWNGRFRDEVRDFWRGEEGMLPALATRFAGSSDLYSDDARNPYASVNFVTAHDGFTLRDLVSYNGKHNEANGEDNNDGANDNRSWNCGAEGPTDDKEVNALRSRQQRNFLATLLLAQGVPMLLGGDEIGHTQQGNNNAYCQDSDISWLDWESADTDLTEFTRQLIALRRANHVLHRRRFFTGQPQNGSPVPDLQWFEPGGTPMEAVDWHTDWSRSVAAFLNGDAMTEMDRQGQTEISDSFYVCFNGYWDPVTFVLPGPDYGARWEVVLDTDDWTLEAHEDLEPGDSITVAGRAVVALSRPPVEAT